MRFIENVKILIIDDELPIRQVLKASLEDEGYIVECAHDGVTGLRMVKDFTPDIILLDIWMPGKMDGIAVLEDLNRNGHQNKPQVIMMSGHGNIETAVKSTKLGAWDFVEKPLSIDRISILIKNILTFQQMKFQKDALLSKLRNSIVLLGESPQMMQIKQSISRIASTSSHCLLMGAKGTGKELVARNIHYLSERAVGPFIELNCSAIPEELMISELFGFEPQAFPGATATRVGKIEHADGGTLFLEDISQLTLSAQEALMSFLITSKVSRLGSLVSNSFDVRIIASTTQNLAELSEKGEFSSELLHRLSSTSLHLPSLRERPLDVEILLDYFSQYFAQQGGFRPKRFSDAALTVLQGHLWPGNVRELKNFIERVYILTPGHDVEPYDLRFAGLTEDLDQEGAFEIASFRDARARFEKEYLMTKLREYENNISKTAEAIGLERSYLHRKIKYYGIET